MPRRSRKEQRPGQLGQYWLSKRPGYEGPEDSWHRTWYDASARQTRRVSLGTSEFAEASEKLGRWFVENERPRKAARSDVAIAAVLNRYWVDHAQHLPSSPTEHAAIQSWLGFWREDSVGDITPAKQTRFRAKLAEKGTGRGGIDRILETGRAALNRAVKHEELESAPFIFLLRTKEERRSAPPKGRPLSLDELAKLFDAAASDHAFLFLMIGVGTLARPGAILELGPKQFDADHDRVDLNTPGRVQNRKYRPILPVAAALRPWLEHGAGDRDRYVTYRGEPIASPAGFFRRLVATAKLTGNVTPYSVRHTMAREMRKRRVPTEQLNLFLGHLPDGADEQTAIYAPYEPEYLADAVAAVEAIYQQLAKLSKRELILKPRLVVGGASVVAIGTGKAIRGGIGEEKRLQVRRLILDRVPHAEIVRRTGASDGTVSVIRQDMKRTMALLKATK